MQISVSSTLTVYYDGQFWVGLVKHVEDGRFGIARIVFGAEPSDEEILQFVMAKWEKLVFFDDEPTAIREPAKNPKRRIREASKALKQPAMGTKAQNKRLQISGRQRSGGRFTQEANAVRRMRKRASSSEE